MILVEQKKYCLWIRLNNPSFSNALNYQMIDQLVDALTQAENQDEIRVVIITGVGKNFCSGGDLNQMRSKTEMFAGESNELRRRYEQGIQKISRSVEQFSKPLVAMVNGAAAGAGCDLACMCDLRIGSAKSKFIESFVKLGLVPGDGGSFFLQRVVGYAKAMEMTLTAEAVDGVEAYRIGLLNRLVEESSLESETQNLADMLAQQPPIAMQLSKKAMKLAYRSDLASTLDLLSAYQGIAQRTHDHFESLDALNEKRVPHFENR